MPCRYIWKYPRPLSTKINWKFSWSWVRLNHSFVREHHLSFHGCSESVFPFLKHRTFQLFLPAADGLIHKLCCLCRHSVIGADTFHCSLLLDLLHLNPSIRYVDEIWANWSSIQKSRHGGTYQQASLSLLSIFLGPVLNCSQLSLFDIFSLHPTSCTHTSLASRRTTTQLKIFQSCI